MDNDKLKLSEINCFVLSVIPVTKLIFLPSVLAKFSEEGCFISMLLAFIPDLIITLFIILKNRRYGLSPYSLIEQSVCKGLAKTLYIIYALYFFIKALIFVTEQKFFVESSLYETTANFFSFTPFFVVSFYLAIKDLRTIGRCSSLTVIAFVVGMATAFFLSALEADYNLLLPLFCRQPKDYLSSITKTLFWFGDSSYILFFCGHFESGKKDMKILLSYGISAGIVILFTAIFYGVFGPIAKYQLYAVTQTTKYSVVLANVIRFDYIATMMCMFAGIIAMAIPIYFTVDLIVHAFGFKSKAPTSAVVNILLAVIVTVFSGKIVRIIDFSSTTVMPYFLIIGYILPIFVLLLKPKDKLRAEKTSRKDSVKVYKHEKTQT